MANTLLTLTMITREALRVLHNNIVFAKGVNRQYSKEFAVSGAKIGDTLNVRLPNQYYLRKGQTISIQNTAENSVPVKLTTQYGVDTSFSSADLTISLDDFGKRILTPAMAKISGGIDYDGLGQVANVFNAVGTPGSTPGTNTGANLATVNAPQIYLNAGMMLDNYATPRDENRRVVMNPAAHAVSVNALSGLFQDSGSISEQYRKGVLGSALGFEFAMDQNVNLLSTGSANRTANAVTISGANQSGTTLVANITTANGTVNAGETFTIANITSINPENQQSTGQLPYFTVLANATANAGGIISLTISPAITANGANVANGTVSALPANGATIVFAATANSSNTVMNVAYHQDAFTLATADLVLPGGVDFAARENYDGISMRIVRAYDIINDLFPARIDVLGGWATLRPSMACKIWG